MSISISGTAFSDTGTTPLGSGITVAARVNGGASDAGTTTTNASGQYTIAGITAAAAALLTIYLKSATPKAVTITTSTGADITGIDLYQNYGNLRSDNGGSLTMANISTALTNTTTDITAIFASHSTTQFTTAAGIGIYIMSGQTFAPGSSTTCTVKGDWLNNGTFTAATGGTVSLQGTGSQKLKSNGSGFQGLTIAGSGGTYTLQDALTTGIISVNGNLTVTAGTLDVSASNYSVTANGSFTVTTGSFTARNGTVNAGGQINAASTSFYNLTVPASDAVLMVANVTVTNALTIGSNATFNLNNHNLTVTGATFTNSGTLGLTGTETLTGFTNDTSNGGTVRYDGGASTTYTSLVAGNAYNNLILRSTTGSATVTYQLSSALTVSGTLTLSESVNSATLILDANGQTISVTGATTITGITGGAAGTATYKPSTATQTLTGGLTITNSASIVTASSGTINLGGNFANTGTFTAGTSTVTLNGTGNQTLSGSTTFYNLAGTCTTARSIIFTDGTTTTVSNAVTFTGASGQLLTLTGTSTGGWTIAMPATQTISYVEPSYSTATGNTAVAGSTSVDGGHNVNWTFGGGAASGSGGYFGQSYGE